MGCEQSGLANHPDAPKAEFKTFWAAVKQAACEAGHYQQMSCRKFNITATDENYLLMDFAPPNAGPVSSAFLPG